MQSVTPMQLVLTLMDHTTAVVFMATVEMEGIAQVHKYLIAAHKSTRFSLYPGINLCEVGPTDCHTNATCLDRDGGYDCECNDGYTGNGTHCEGIMSIDVVIV